MAMTFYRWEIDFEIDGKIKTMLVNPDNTKAVNGMPMLFCISFDSHFYTWIQCTPLGWKSNMERPQEIIDRIGEIIIQYYE